METLAPLRHVSVSCGSSGSQRVERTPEGEPIRTRSVPRACPHRQGVNGIVIQTRCVQLLRGRPIASGWHLSAARWNLVKWGHNAAMTTPPPGWYPDGQGNLRYWDGVAWTDQVRTSESVAHSADPVQQAEASGALSRITAGIRKVAEDRQAARAAYQREQEAAAAEAGALMTSGVFGNSTIEIYAGGFVRIAEGDPAVGQVAKVTRKTPYERLRSIKFSAPQGPQQAPAAEASALIKGASALVKGGTGILKASAPGLAMAGVSQVAKAKMGKATLTIATDKAIHMLTNESNNGWMKVSRREHYDVARALEEVGNAVLKDLTRDSAPEPQAGSSGTAAPESSPGNNLGERLRELATLHREGILSDEEFAQAKARLLGL